MSLPCLATGRLIYLSEAWMRQGGLDFTKKGPVFESYVIGFLDNALKSSPLKHVAMVVSRPMKFATQNGKKEEVDLILIVNNTVLICEVKCILWPTNAIQYANYRNTLQGAAEQASRKELAAKSNLTSFSKELLRLGYNLPQDPEIISCVLSNSAVYAGFKIDNTPVVDLHILRKFFENKFVPLAIKYKGKTKEIRSIEFYSDPNNAGSALLSYLNNPPQLDNINISMRPRTTRFPIENQKFGPLIYETSRVISDVDTLMSDVEVANSNLFLKSQDKEASLLGPVVG
jgi:hypothetical protein